MIIPVPVVPVYGLSIEPLFSPEDGWYDIPNGYKTFNKIVYNDWGGYVKYKISIQVKQLKSENNAFYDYYGITVRVNYIEKYLVDTSSEKKISYLKLLVDPDNIKPGFVESAVPIDWDPKTGHYNQIVEGQIRVGINIGGLDFTIVWDIQLYGVYVKAIEDYNKMEWRHTRNIIGQLVGSSVLGEHRDGRWIFIFAVPNFYGGYPNGDLTFKFHMKVEMSYQINPWVWESGTYDCFMETSLTLYDINN